MRVVTIQSLTLPTSGCVEPDIGLCNYKHAIPVYQHLFEDYNHIKRTSYSNFFWGFTDLGLETLKEEVERATEMLSRSFDDTSTYKVLVLDVPDDLCLVTDFYNFSDEIFAYEHPEELPSVWNSIYSLRDSEKQVIFPYIDSAWIIECHSVKDLVCEKIPLMGIHLSLPTDVTDLFFYTCNLGATTFQVFLRNNRNMRMREWTKSTILRFNDACFKSGIWSFVVHAPYAMNPGTADAEARRRYTAMIIEDLKLLQQLAGKKYYVLHPGSATNCTYEEALNNLKSVLKEVEPYSGTTTITVELMAGQGSQLLRDDSHIRWCINNIPGVRFCYDTCHVFAAGLSVIGTLLAYKDYIDVLHINGSATVKSSRVDRHANLNTGHLPLEQLNSCFTTWRKLFPDKPVILETPSQGIVDDFNYLKGLYQSR